MSVYRAVRAGGAEKTSVSHELKATRSAGPSPEQKCRPLVKEPESGATLPKSVLLRWRAHEAHSGGSGETREIRKGG